MADQTSDTDPVLERPSRTVTYRGMKLTVGPLELRQFGPFSREIRYALPGVMRLIGASELSEFEFGAAALDFLSENAEQAQHALAIAVNQDADWIGGGTADEVIELARAVFEVNRDFFTNRIAPLLVGLRQKGESPTSGDGLTPSTT